MGFEDFKQDCRWDWSQQVYKKDKGGRTMTVDLIEKLVQNLYGHYPLQMNDKLLLISIKIVDFAAVYFGEDVDRPILSAMDHLCQFFL